MGYTEAFADAFNGINMKASLDDNPIYDNPMMDEDPGPDKPGLLPPPPNPAAIGVPPPPQIGDIKQSKDGGMVSYTPSGWKPSSWEKVPPAPEYSEWADLDSPKKMILKGIMVVSSTGPVFSTTSWPGWANNSLVSPSFFSKSSSAPPKKQDPEPMDLGNKRRIDLSE